MIFTETGKDKTSQWKKVNLRKNVGEYIWQILSMFLKHFLTRDLGNR
jgi:uncharacterized membrane protein